MVDGRVAIGNGAIVPAQPSQHLQGSWIPALLYSRRAVQGAPFLRIRARAARGKDPHGSECASSNDELLRLDLVQLDHEMKTAGASSGFGYPFVGASVQSCDERVMLPAAPRMRAPEMSIESAPWFRVARQAVRMQTTRDLGVQLRPDSCPGPEKRKHERLKPERR